MKAALFYGPSNTGFGIAPNPGAVNFVQVAGSLPGYPVNISANGADANINISISPKGTGIVQIGSTLNLYSNLNFQAAGRAISMKSGANAKIGTAALVGGTVVVANTSVTANSIIQLTPQTGGANSGSVYVSAKTNGNSFTISSTNAADTSVIGYTIFEMIP